MPVINPGETVAERNQRLGFGTIAPKDTNLVYTSGEKSPTPGQEQILGPYTPPAPSPTENPDPTIGDVYSGYVPGENTELNDAESAYLKMLKEQSQPVDEDAIRRKTQEQFQAEIDAVNRLFAEKKAEEARVGQGRIGSGTAVQARRGLLGSTFGEAQKERVVSYNQSIQDAIQAEQQLQLASIMSEVRQSAKDEAAAKTLARQQGAVAYVEFLRGQADRKQQRVSDAITNVLNSDTEVSEDLFASLAKELGVSVDIIKSQYNSAKKANDKANAKEAVKGIEVNGSIIDPVTGDVIYQGTPKAESYSGVVGEYEYYKKQEENAGRTPLSFNEYQNADANRKARAEKALIGGIDPALVSLGTAYGSKFDSSPIVKQFNEVQNKKLGIDRLLSDGTVGGAQDVALVFDFMKALDPTSVVRESEYDTASKSGNLFMGSLAKFNGLFKAEGGKLPESVREEFQKIVGQKYSTVKQQYSNLYSENKRKMEALGITDPDVFLTDYTGGENPIVNTDTSNSIDETAVSQLIDELGISRQEALNALGFNTEVQTSLKGKQLISVASSQPDNTNGGQCGRFVNKLTGLGLGDSYQSKVAKMDSSIKTPAPGMVFIMPIQGSPYGHTGIILSIKDGIATVKDSNWYKQSAPEKVKTHTIPVSEMTGFTYPKKVIT